MGARLAEEGDWVTGNRLGRMIKRSGRANCVVYRWLAREIYGHSCKCGSKIRVIKGQEKNLEFR